MLDTDMVRLTAVYEVARWSQYNKLNEQTSAGFSEMVDGVTATGSK